MKAGGFTAGFACGVIGGLIVHEWGHKEALNYFKPGSVEAIEIGISGGGVHCKSNFSNIENGHLKFAGSVIAGPVAGSLGSFSLFQLLAKSNIVESTDSKFFLGLEAASLFNCYLHAMNLFSPAPHRDGPVAIRALFYKDTSLPSVENVKWYHHFYETALIGPLLGITIAGYYQKQKSLTIVLNIIKKLKRSWIK